jgi:hypothetical protein
MHCPSRITKPIVEQANPAMAGVEFRVLAQVNGSFPYEAQIDFQISVTVRRLLEDSGFPTVRPSGEWNSQQEVMRSVCETYAQPPFDGVLFVWYNRLELRDCRTGSTAYSITSDRYAEGGEENISALTNRLIRYLRQGIESDTTSASPETPAPSGSSFLR